MGNCFSIQLSGADALINRCWDCIAPRFSCLPQLQINLQKLADERDQLTALKDHVKGRVTDQQGPQMKQLDAVRLWVSKVEEKLAEVDRLIIDGENEKNKLCFGGYCSKTCCSSYILATAIVETLTDVIDLRKRGNFETVVEKVVVEPEYISQLQNDLVALQAATEELRALKVDVIRRVNVEEGPRMKQLEQVKVWISSVDLMIPQFVSLIRDGPQEIQRLHDGDLSFSTFGERVAKALTDVAAVKQKGVLEEVVGTVPIEPVVERPGEPAMGLESMLEKLWNWLMEEDIGVIGIYGMGGVGKTTLLTETNNSFLKSPHDFDFVIWVVASKDSRLDNMQEEIAGQIGLSEDPQWKEKQFSEKATIIFRVLQKKKFILLMDDLWNRIELKDIGVPHPNKQNISKVVFTTRSEEVCGEMEAQRSILLKPFAWEEAWQLFQDKVGRETLDADPDIPNVAKDVAKESAGLPLALVTVGRAMACRKTPQEWKHALEILRTSATAFRGMGDKIFPNLKFSYDNLPNEKVKSCLLYCTLFPDDHLIPKEELIQKWVCESFWDDDNSQIDAINEGYSIVATLFHVCLLEDKGEWVKMHDVIRDMCLWIACEVEKKKENYFVRAGSQLTKAPDMGKLTEVRRISLMQNYIEQLTDVPKTPSLLTLFLCKNRRLKVINDGFFQHMKALTVLDLSRTELTVLPTAISELVSLQYLDISETIIEALPWELTNLKRLKFFNLESTVWLALIPKGMMASFQLLQVLKLKACRFQVDTSMVEELECLEELKELTITILGHLSLVHLLLSSKKLSSCTRYLEMEHINYSSSSSSPKHQDTPAEIFGELVGTKTPSLHESLRKICFTSLRKVDINWRKYHLQDLTWVILGPNLTELRVKSVSGLEKIISYKNFSEVAKDNEYENVNLFARLQVLILYDLPELKSIWWKPLLFPSLKKIRVSQCPMLKKLPLNSDSVKGNNLVIQGQKSWWHELEWEDDAALTTFASCFQPWPQCIIKKISSARDLRHYLHLKSTGIPCKFPD